MSYRVVNERTQVVHTHGYVGGELRPLTIAGGSLNAVVVDGLTPHLQALAARKTVSIVEMRPAKTAPIPAPAPVTESAPVEEVQAVAVTQRERNSSRNTRAEKTTQ